MNSDPVYEDCNEDGENYRDKYSSKPKWYSVSGLGQQDLLHQAFNVCSSGNKKGFGSPREHKDWKTICKKIDKGVIPVEWVEEQLKICRDKNTDRIRIVFQQFECMVLNIEKQKDWEAKHRIARGEIRDFRAEESHDFAD